MHIFTLRHSRPVWLAIIIIPACFLALWAYADPDPSADVKADKTERNSRTVTDRTTMTDTARTKASAQATSTPSATPISKAKLKKQLQAAKAEAVRKGDTKQAKKLQVQLDQLNR